MKKTNFYLSNGKKIFRIALKIYNFFKINIHYRKIRKISSKECSHNLIKNIYICHHAPLKQRKLKLNKILSNFKTNIEWVEKYMPSEIEKRYENIIDIKNLNIDNNKPGIDQYQYKYYENSGRKLTISELSLYLKMKYCFEDQIKNSYEIVIIFEDDVLLTNNIENYLNFCALEFHNHIPELDCLMIGTAFNFKSKYYQPNKIIHYGENQFTRCTHAMMFSLKSAKIIYRNLDTFNWPIDYKLNEIMVKESLKVGWAEPALFQSSILSNHESTIVKINKLI